MNLSKSPIPRLWRRANGVNRQYRLRMDLFETEALAFGIPLGGEAPSRADVNEAQGVLRSLHQCGDTIECGCREDGGAKPPLMRIVEGAEGFRLVTSGSSHSGSCPFRFLQLQTSRQPPEVAVRAAPNPTPVFRPQGNPFGLNNLTPLIGMPMPGG